MPTETFTITANAQDDGAQMSDASWATVVSGGGSFSARTGNATAVVVKAANFGEFYIYNALFRFDTSSLPDAAVITAARLKIYVDSANDTADDVEYAADFYDFGGEPAVSGDWEASSSGNAIATIDPDLLTTSAVNNIDLTGLSGINKSGYTGIRIAPKDTTEPTGDNFIRFAANEHGSGDPAALEVTYAIPVARHPFVRSDAVHRASRW